MNDLLVHRNTGAAGEAVQPLECRFGTGVRANERLADRIEFERRDARAHFLFHVLQRGVQYRTAARHDIDFAR